MAERTATWKVLADFSRVRREAKKTKDELESLQKTRKRTNELNDSEAQSSNGLVTSLKDLSAARRRATAETRALTQAERDQVAADEGVISASRRMEQALLSRQRANLALEASQRRLADAQKKHGLDSDQYARALLSVSRATLEADAADRRHIASVERHSSALKEAERSVRGLDGGGRGLIGTLGALAGGFGRATFSVKLFGGSLRTLGIVALIPAISMLVTWLSQLSAGAIAAIGPLTRLAGVLAAMPQAFSVAGGAIATFIGAFSGIGEALKQGVKAQQEAGGAAQDLAEAESDAAYQIQQAQKGVRDAREAAAESARQNARAVEMAERQVQDALRASREAHRELNEVRAEEKRRIDELMDSLYDLELQERGAALSVEEARERLNAVLQDPGSTDLAKRQAQLAYDEALNRLDQVKKDKDRADKDAKKAQKDGVEGSDAVIDAKERERDANLQLSDSQYALNEAIRAQAKASRDSAEAIAEAQHNLQEAREAADDAGQSIGGAASAYQDAMDELSPAGRKFVLLLMGMRDELKRLKFAAQEGLLPGLGRALTTLLKLMPLAEKGLFSFGQIMGRTAERGANMLTSGPFTEMFGRLLKSNERLLRLSGKGLLNITAAIVYLMDAARPFTTWLFRTIEGWTQFWKESAKAGNETGGIRDYLDKTREVLEILGRSFGNLWDTFKNIGQAGDDLGMDLWRSFERITKGWAKWTGSIEGQSQLKEWFDNARATLHETSELLGAITRGFFDLGRKNSVAPLIKSLRTDLGPALYEIMENLQGEFGQAIVDILSGIARLVAALTSAGEGGLTTFARTVADVIGTLAGFIENNPAVQSALSGLLKMLGVLAALNFLTTILGLRKIIGLLSGGKGLLTALRMVVPAIAAISAPVLLAVAAIAALGIAAVVLYKKWEPFREFVNWVGSAIKKKLLSAFKKIKPALEDLGDAFKGLWEDGKKGEGLIPVVKALWKAYKVFATFMVTKVWPILAKFYGFLGSTAVDVVVDMVTGIAKAATGLIKILDGLFKIIHGLFTGDWSEMWDGAKQVFSGFVDVFVGMFKLMVKAPLRLVINFVKKVVGFFKWLYDVLVGHSIIPDLAKAIIKIFTEFPVKVMKAVWNFMRDLAKGFREGLSDVAGILKDFVTDKIGDLISAIKDIPSKIRDGLGEMKDAGKALMGAFWEGLKAIGSGAGGLAEGVWDTLRGFLNDAIQKINDGVPDKINIKGAPDIDLPNNPFPQIPGFARGGSVPGEGNRDSVPAMLMPGEFVMRRDAVKRIGVSRLSALNEGRKPRRYARGGSVLPDHKRRRPKGVEGVFGDASPTIQKFHRGGPVLGMTPGAKGSWVKALEDLFNKKQDGTWDRALNQRLRSERWNAMPNPFKPNDRQKANFMKWVEAADPKQVTRDKKYTAVKGDTVGSVLKDFYGKRFKQHLNSFLKTNGFVKDVKTSVTVPGGASEALQRALRFAAGQAGKPYIWGGVGPRGYDCSGYQSAITNVIKGNSPYRRLFATGSMAGALPGLGFRSGLGGSLDYSVGWYTGDPGHTAGTLGRLNVESTGDHVRNGADAKSAASFPNRMHLPLGGGKRTETRTSQKFTKKLSDRLKVGDRLTLNNVPEWQGSRSWAQALERFNIGGNAMENFVSRMLPMLKRKKTDPRKYSDLMGTFRQRQNADEAAYTALNERLGLGKIGSYTNDTRKALQHAMAHTYKRPHDDLSFRPWKNWTPLEAAIIQQQQANARAKKWQNSMTTLSMWGLEDLVDHLFSKGADDAAAFNTAVSASKNRRLAERLNEEIKKGGSFSGEDIEHIIKLMGFLMGTGKGKGLREVARHLGLSDYNVVKLWKDGNAAGRFNKIPGDNRKQLDTDVRSYDAGTFYFNEGGSVPGVGNSDTVPAMLTPGEFVIKKQAAKALGLNNLWALNNLQKFAGGGLVMGPDVKSIPTKASVGVSQRSIGNVTYVTNNKQVTYDVKINNPIAEKGTYSLTKMLQRQSALGRKDDI